MVGFGGSLGRFGVKVCFLFDEVVGWLSDFDIGDVVLRVWILVDSDRGDCCSDLCTGRCAGAEYMYHNPLEVRSKWS